MFNDVILKLANFPMILRGCTWVAGSALGYLLGHFPWLSSFLLNFGVTVDPVWTAGAAGVIGLGLAHIVSKALHLADKPVTTPTN